MKKKMFNYVVCAVAIFAVSSIVMADWDETESFKWYQRPDLNPTGVDICVDDTGDLGQRTIGDDFECRDPEPITGVHIWGSWRGDIKGTIEAIHVQFYTDDPVGPGGSNPDNEWSTPDLLLYDQWFDAAQFTERLYYTMPDDTFEWWWDPRTPASAVSRGDQNVWQYNIDLSSAPFQQEGTAEVPIIYWLVIEVKLSPDVLNTSFGWKTRDRDSQLLGGGHFMDDAVWYGAQWVDIEYPGPANVAPGENPHPFYPDSVDMSFVLTTGDIPDEIDWGDAPDDGTGAGYPTLSISGGANHIIGGPWLGDSTDAPDGEIDGQPTLNADGDDNDGNDDENGVAIPSLVQGVTANITFQVSSGDGAGGTVSGWIDYNGNKIWGDLAIEQVVAASYPDGTYTVPVTAPAGSVLGTTYARFRITRDTTITGPTGSATDGEVEDYTVTIRQATPELDFGDAPEGPNAIAYPSTGVVGQFPTCMTIGPATWIQHTNFGAYFGPTVDFESDGNAGLCPTGACFPPYDQDECFQDGDAGLIIPDSFTIDAALNVVPCAGAGNISLGQTCTTAVWGANIDIDVTNFMPSNTTGYVNVLVDWNQDGIWAGSSSCPNGSVPEHVLVDFPVPNGYTGPLSGLMAAGTGFTIGPNAGYVWVRFSITEQPVAATGMVWDGSGSFEDGETEDYMLQIDPAPSDEKLKFQQLPLDGVMVGDLQYWGHDELSTAYRNPDNPEWFEGCYMADDFADLEHSPVIEVKWWGSYLENEIMDPGVKRFLIAFEKDVAVDDPDNQVPYSHPGEVLQTQFVSLVSAGTAPNPGEYTETLVSYGGPPCNENLFEYVAVLENPFPQDPNTVYWIKIVALVDMDPAIWAQLQNAVANSGLTLCDFLNLPFTQQQQYGLEEPVTRWGWHNRDYTQMDPYASTPPAVNPGEHVAGVLQDGTEVWHFQDDAVSGDVFINEAAPDMPFVDQPIWIDEYYKYAWPLCPPITERGVDGPPEIEEFSKDLAFELWTPTECVMPTAPFYSDWITWGKPNCWCYQKNCRGDADGIVSGPFRVAIPDLVILLGAYNKVDALIPLGGICADFDHIKTGPFRVAIPDLQILLIYYNVLDPLVPVCPMDWEGDSDNDYYFWTN